MEVADRVGNARRAISGKPAHGPPLDVEGGGPRRALSDVAELHLVPATFVGGKARTGEREVDVDRLAASGSPFGDFICATIVGIFGGGGGRGGCGAACICMLSRLGCPRVSNPCGIVLFCARALCFSACCSAFLWTAFTLIVLSDESACSPASCSRCICIHDGHTRPCRRACSTRCPLPWDRRRALPSSHMAALSFVRSPCSCPCLR